MLKVNNKKVSWYEKLFECRRTEFNWMKLEGRIFNRKDCQKTTTSKVNGCYEVKKYGDPYFAEKARLITKKIETKGSQIDYIADQYRSLLDFINRNYDKKSPWLLMSLKIWQRTTLTTLYNWLPKGVFNFDY